MSLTRGPMTLATHAWFVRYGTAFTLPSAGTASKTSKPDNDDTSWTDGKMGIIKSIDLDPGKDAPIDILQGTPGKVQRADVIPGASKPVYSIEFSEVDPLAIELVFDTLALTSSSTQYNPGEKQGELNGWLKVQQYDHTDTLKNTLDVYGNIRLKGSVKAELGQQVSYTIEFRPIFSTLNTGTL